MAAFVSGPITDSMMVLTEPLVDVIGLMIDVFLMIVTPTLEMTDAIITPFWTFAMTPPGSYLCMAFVVAFVGRLALSALSHTLYIWKRRSDEARAAAMVDENQRHAAAAHNSRPRALSEESLHALRVFFNSNEHRFMPELIAPLPDDEDALSDASETAVAVSELLDDGDDDDPLACRVCWDAPRDTVMQPCNHLATCRTCTHKLTNCPVCRRRIAGTMHVFVS